ncbi:MAG: hypothetical protein K2N31_01505 [Treponemataceae bacterium]|nr:hypothetical protein [Treponemataceae bacterium]
MKKIVGVILAAGLLTGITTAADIGFSYKGSNYFKSYSRSDKAQPRLDNVKGTPEERGFLDFFDRADCMSIKLSGTAGGVVIDFDSNEDGLGIKQDEYYGWLNFTLPIGALQVTAGRWNGRYADRIRTDKGDLDAEDFELYKPGVINGTAGADSDNLTRGNLGIVAAWTLADKLPGVLVVKLGVANTISRKNIQQSDGWNWNPDAEAGDVKVKAGFTGEVAYRQDGLFNINFAARSITKTSYSFGLWFSPLMAEKLQLTIGGTVASGKALTVDNPDKGKEVTFVSWGERKTEWGVDLRARYKVTDTLSITTMNNISSGTASTTKAHDGKDGNQLVLWDMLNATYAFADNLKAALTLQSVSAGLDDDHENRWDVIISPSLAIQATERVTVTTSLRAEINDIRNWTVKVDALTIPVIFSYNY